MVEIRERKKADQHLLAQVSTPSGLWDIWGSGAPLCPQDKEPCGQLGLHCSPTGPDLHSGNLIVYFVVWHKSTNLPCHRPILEPVFLLILSLTDQLMRLEYTTSRKGQNGLFLTFGLYLKCFLSSVFPAPHPVGYPGSQCTIVK